MAAIFGAPDPASYANMKRKRSGEGEEGEEEGEEYESEAGLLLSQWMAGGSGSIRGMPQRTGEEEGSIRETTSRWLPPAAAETMRAADVKTQDEPSKQTPKISKLTKVD